MCDFLVKVKARRSLEIAFNRQNGWKTMAELTKKLGWETSMEWSKEERKEALGEFGNKAQTVGGADYSELLVVRNRSVP